MVDDETGRYFVIGTAGVNHVNLITNSPNIQNVNANPANTNVFPPGDNTPYAVVLLYAKSPKDLRAITLHKFEDRDAYRPLVILDNLGELIAEKGPGHGGLRAEGTDKSL